MTIDANNDQEVTMHTNSDTVQMAIEEEIGDLSPAIHGTPDEAAPALVNEAVNSGEPRSEVPPRLDEATDKNAGPTDLTAVAGSKARVAKAREMAAENYSSRQIGQALKIKNPYEFMKRHGIEVPADKFVKNTHHIDSTRIVSVGSSTLDGLVSSYDLVVIDELDPEDLVPLVESMTESLRKINGVHRQLKERIQ